MIPEPPGRDHLSRIRDVAERLRQDYASRYIDLASQVEAELGLDQASIDAACLGRIDTFRFEERSLLACAGELTAKRQFLEVNPEVLEHVDPIFYGDLRQAAFKALGLN